MIRGVFLKTIFGLLIIVMSLFAISQENGYARSPILNKKDWPQWRGPNRDGISTETGIIKSWGEGAPQILWRANSGDGYSGMSVVDGRLYTIYGKLGEELAVCLDVTTGETIWSYRLDSMFNNNFGNGPRSTPTVDGNIVYVVSAKANLAALNAVKGTEIWRHDLQSEYGAKIPTWGVATSPLVYGDYLLVDVGGSGENGFVAFNKKNGEVAWKTGTDLPGYSAPVAIEINGKSQVLNFTGNALISVDPLSGKRFWELPWQTSYDVNAATPVFIAPDKVFVSSGYDVGGALLKITANGYKEIWKTKEMRNQFSTSLYLNGFLYGFDESTFKCMDINTQETKWAERGFGKGSHLYADGQIILLSERGKLVLIEATPTEYKETASAQMLKGRCWTVPTLVDKKLYIRNQKEILALNFAK